MISIPNVFPIAAQDIFGYLAGKYTSNNQLSCILRFDGPIDEIILRRAIRLSFDFQPVLGCSFDTKSDFPQWHRIGNIDELNFYRKYESDSSRGDVDDQIRAFIVKPFDGKADCRVKAGLFGNTSNILCIKIDHACSDGAGLKQYVMLVADLYNKISNTNADLNPIPVFDDRGDEPVLAFWETTGKTTPHLERAAPPQPTVAFPGNPGANNDQTFLYGSLPPDRFEHLRRSCRQHGVTVNDALVAAIVRAVGRTASLVNNTVSLNLTVDLRKYLPNRKTAAITNISSGEILSVKYTDGTTFDSVLSQVNTITTELKSRNPGLAGAQALNSFKQLTFTKTDEWFRNRREQSIEANLTIPYFSNLGTISDQPIIFGTRRAVECIVIGQALFAPGLIMLAGTYESMLTLSVNFFKSTTSREVIKSLIDSMIDDLNQWVNSGA